MCKDNIADILASPVFLRDFRHYAGTIGRKYGLTSHEIEDLFQTTLSEMLSRSKTTVILSPVSYIRVALWYQVINAVRRNSRRQEVSLENPVVSRQVSPLDAIVMKERLERMDAAIASLSEKERDVIHLHYREGLPTRQIAERIGSSQSHVVRTLLKAAQAIRKQVYDK